MKSIREEAARWFARIGNAPPGHPDRGQFETWLLTSPAHAAEYAAFAALWSDFDSSTQLALLSQAMEKRKAALREIEDARRSARRNLLKRGALGLFLCGGTGTLAWRALSAWYAQPLLQLSLATPVAQMERRMLPDGSTILLNARSTLAVAYYRDRREVRLDSGEAIFEVARDAGKPFVVDCGLARVTVLGTRFSVARLDDRVRISVTTGKVHFAGLRDAGSQAIELGAGEVAEVTAHAEPRRINRNAADSIAWEHGTLVFDGATLTEIAETLSRYRVRRVRANATELRITAVVQIADIEGFLRALPSIAPLRVESSDGETRISPR